MKACGYCGRENPDDAERCCECGTGFATPAEPEQPHSLSELLVKPIPSRLRWWLLLAAWGMVVLATLVTKPDYVLAAPCFPVGLAYWLPKREETAIVAWIAMFPMVVGWAIYFLLSMSIVLARKPIFFVFLYIVLCVLLAMNFVGCQRTLEAVSKIE
jgi:hypothetical protein